MFRSLSPIPPKGLYRIPNATQKKTLGFCIKMLHLRQQVSFYRSSLDDPQNFHKVKSTAGAVNNSLVIPSQRTNFLLRLSYHLMNARVTAETHLDLLRTRAMLSTSVMLTRRLLLITLLRRSSTRCSTSLPAEQYVTQATGSRTHLSPVTRGF